MQEQNCEIKKFTTLSEVKQIEGQFICFLSKKSEKLDKLAWIEKYELAKEYYKHYGNLDFTQKFRTLNGYSYDEDGVKLGIWLSTQRYAYCGSINSKLSIEKIKLLENISINWFHNNRDKKLQLEKINKDNIKRKQIEILNRFITSLNEFEDVDNKIFTSREDVKQIENGFIKHLKKNRRG